jgi:hypothetical protein
VPAAEEKKLAGNLARPIPSARITDASHGRGNFEPGGAKPLDREEFGRIIPVCPAMFFEN